MCYLHLLITQAHSQIIKSSWEGLGGYKEKAKAPHSSTLAWKIPWTEEPARLQSIGSLRVGHDWATSLSLFTFMHWRRKWQPTPVFLPGESQRQWTPLYGVTQSQTRLKQLSSSSSNAFKITETSNFLSFSISSSIWDGFLFLRYNKSLCFLLQQFCPSWNSIWCWYWKIGHASLPGILKRRFLPYACDVDELLYEGGV